MTVYTRATISKVSNNISIDQYQDHHHHPHGHNTDQDHKHESNQYNPASIVGDAQVFGSIDSRHFIRHLNRFKWGKSGCSRPNPTLTYCKNFVHSICFLHSTYFVRRGLIPSMSQNRTIWGVRVLSFWFKCALVVLKYPSKFKEFP